MYGAVVHPTLPDVIDLRPQMPAVILDQGALGSCTANAIASAVEYDLMKQQLPVFQPSRLFIYYNERRMEGTVAEDAGARIRDGIKSLNRYGVCSEEHWPYSDTVPGPFMVQPPTTAYQEALAHRAVSYQRVLRSIPALRSCLASGYPFVFGFSVFESFESDEVARTGIVPVPLASEQLLGGHAALGVGSDHPNERIIVRNSWGKSWGDGGYCYMPYSYFLDEGLSDDFWTVRSLRG